MKPENGFPYFQFVPDKWLTGKVNAFDLDEQGLFLHMVMQAWSGGGVFNVCSTSVQRRFRKDKQWVEKTVEAFIEVGIIQKNGAGYHIKFVEEQIDGLRDIRHSRSEAGKASARARAGARADAQPEPAPIPSEESIEEKSIEEKSSVLNTSSTHVEHMFEEFWDAFGKKVGRGQALKSWKAATKKADPAEIMAGVKAQQGCRQWADGYQPNPATWLNQERWMDDLAALNGNNNGSSSAAKPRSYMR